MSGPGAGDNGATWQSGPCAGPAHAHPLRTATGGNRSRRLAYDSVASGVPSSSRLFPGQVFAVTHLLHFVGWSPLCPPVLPPTGSRSGSEVQASRRMNQAFCAYPSSLPRLYGLLSASQKSRYRGEGSWCLRTSGCGNQMVGRECVVGPTMQTAVERCGFLARSSAIALGAVSRRTFWRIDRRQAGQRPPRSLSQGVTTCGTMSSASPGRTRLPDTTDEVPDGTDGSDSEATEHPRLRGHPCAGREAGQDTGSGSSLTVRTKQPGQGVHSCQGR